MDRGIPRRRGTRHGLSPPSPSQARAMEGTILSSAPRGDGEWRRRELNRLSVSGWFGKKVMSFGLEKPSANHTEPRHAQKRFFVSVIVSKNAGLGNPSATLSCCCTSARLSKAAMDGRGGHIVAAKQNWRDSRRGGQQPEHLISDYRGKARLAKRSAFQDA